MNIFTNEFPSEKSKHGTWNFEKKKRSTLQFSLNLFHSVCQRIYTLSINFLQKNLNMELKYVFEKKDIIKQFAIFTKFISFILFVREYIVLLYRLLLLLLLFMMKIFLQ